MRDGPKYPLSFLDHFRICRPKNPNSLVKYPLPVAVTCMFSPVNSKPCDISFPSSPSHPASNSSRSSIISLGNCEHQSRSCLKNRVIDDEFQSNGYSKPRIEGKMKMYNSPASSDSDESDMATTYSRIEKKSKKRIKKKSKAKFHYSVSSADSAETHILSSPPTSFKSSCSYSHPLKTVTGVHLDSSERMMQQKHIRPRRLKRLGSKEWKDDGEAAVPLRECDKKKPISERRAPHIVVKRSADPYRDFKRSMLEMICDQKMSDPKEMEHLLMSFLSLNAEQHHKVIIEAFAEIWKDIYCGS